MVFVMLAQTKTDDTMNCFVSFLIDSKAFIRYFRHYFRSWEIPKLIVHIP